jgi:hypothetical protein
MGRLLGRVKKHPERADDGTRHGAVTDRLTLELVRHAGDELFAVGRV